ncbi:MAG: nucleotidyl transferase AbiEii/AbiGii toxin family protein [Dermatophilaceae bacterium]
MGDPRLVSLSHRLRNIAAREGVPPQRVRNRYVFQRVLARLVRDPRWVLKGGFSLELRLGVVARTTKDLDLLLWDAAGLTAADLQDLLDEALDVNLDDGCTFVVRAPRRVRAEDEMPSTWRVVVDVQMARSPFETVTIDVVTRAAEPGDGLDAVTVRPMLGGEPFSVRSVDLSRHAAEKTHAYARIYAHERPSSRVKDLVDLVLLIEEGLLQPSTFARAVEAVFAERNADAPPRDLPDPPGDWRAPFAGMAAEIGLNHRTLDAAAGLVRRFYLTALDDEESR